MIDLGAFPGGWSQIARKHTKGMVVGVDLALIDPIDKITFLHGDIYDPLIQHKLDILFPVDLGIDVVLSDMAHKFTGMRVNRLT